MSESHSHDEIFNAVQEIISAILKVPAEKITVDSALTDLAHVESIKLLRIAGKLERRFDIELNNEQLFRKGRVGDLVNEVFMLQGEEKAS
ncbi:acyl carrier protein [Actinomadura roseirufa]|uniref:acyl carrier protein n=1 Tax=Actinomadura roseirufa TaxID=2094049 RepID=UPI00104199A6|nr:acyl carrier protein [Actinomadura roseirufa]